MNRLHIRYLTLIGLVFFSSIAQGLVAPRYHGRIRLITPSSSITARSGTFRRSGRTILHFIKESDIQELDESSNILKDNIQQNEPPQSNAEEKANTPENKPESTREMLSFALPALGIFLSAPLLSNIDNAFVGKTAGTAGLAALSPGTICIDQMLYLFSFLSLATTGIVSRAYSTPNSKSNSNGEKNENGNDIEANNIAAAREAASTPLTFAIFSGVCLSVFYALFTPKLLAALKVDPILRPAAASYVYWRGAAATAALVQSVCLSVLLATGDAITPLKIVRLSALVNVVGDAFLCVYPFRWGCTGAAAASAFATVFSSGKMLMDLSKKRLLPRIAVPKASDLKKLFEYVGPLFTLIIARMMGFVAMQRRAMTFGTDALAAYQICINTISFFFLFGEPLSQLFQTKLPAFLDAKDRQSTASTMKTVLKLACFTCMGVGLATLLTLTFGVGLFTADPAVQSIVKNLAPLSAFTVMQIIFGIALDGSMLASRDFNFIIGIGVSATAMHLLFLQRCTSLSAVFLSMTLRNIYFNILVLGRIAVGKGALGEILALRKGRSLNLKPRRALGLSKA